MRASRSIASTATAWPSIFAGRAATRSRATGSASAKRFAFTSIIASPRRARCTRPRIAGLRRERDRASRSKRLGLGELAALRTGCCRASSSRAGGRAAPRVGARAWLARSLRRSGSASASCFAEVVRRWRARAAGARRSAGPRGRSARRARGRASRPRSLPASRFCRAASRFCMSRNERRRGLDPRASARGRPRSPSRRPPSGRRPRGARREPGWRG